MQSHFNDPVQYNSKSFKKSICRSFTSEQRVGGWALFTASAVHPPEPRTSAQTARPFLLWGAAAAGGPLARSAAAALLSPEPHTSALATLLLLEPAAPALSIRLAGRNHSW